MAGIKVTKAVTAPPAPVTPAAAPPPPPQPPIDPVAQAIAKREQEIGRPLTDAEKAALTTGKPPQQPAQPAAPSAPPTTGKPPQQPAAPLAEPAPTGPFGGVFKGMSPEQLGPIQKALQDLQGAGITPGSPEAQALGQLQQAGITTTAAAGPFTQAPDILGAEGKKLIDMITATAGGISLPAAQQAAMPEVKPSEELRAALYTKIFGPTEQKLSSLRKQETEALRERLSDAGLDSSGVGIAAQLKLDNQIDELLTFASTQASADAVIQAFDQALKEAQLEATVNIENARLGTQRDLAQAQLSAQMQIASMGAMKDLALGQMEMRATMEMQAAQIAAQLGIAEAQLEQRNFEFLTTWATDTTIADLNARMTDLQREDQYNQWSITTALNAWTTYMNAMGAAMGTKTETKGGGLF